MIIVYYLFLLAAQVRADDAPACDLLYARLNTLDPQLADAYDRAQKLDTDLVQGKKTPKWEDFDNLDKLFADLQQGKANVAAHGQSEELKKILADAAAAAQADDHLRVLGQAHPPLPHSAAYQPTEYELKRLYQQRLVLIDRELPKELKIRVTHIPFDQRQPELVAEARKVVADSESRFDSALFATSGFKDDASLQTAVRAHSAEAKQVMDDLQNENVEFAMRRPQGARWWAPKVGFENQRVTGNSQGAYAPGYRDITEAGLSSTPLSQYKTADPDFKPVYGYLKPVENSQSAVDDSVKHYGPDIYIFKKDHLRDRLTWTAGDSLGLQGHIGDVNHPVATDWNAQFVPWKDRSLLAPHLVDSAKNNQGFVAGMGNDVLIIPGLKAPVAPLPPAGAPVLPRIQYPVRPPAPTHSGDVSKLSEAAAKAYADATQAYMASPEYKDFIEKVSKLETAYSDYSTAYTAYSTSPAYKAYIDGDVYKKFLADTDAYQTAISSHTGSELHSALQNTTLQNYKSLRSGGYVELQFWGPVTFKDVEAFQFEGDPPSGDFLKELLSHGIKIRDARGGTPVPWTPGSP